MVGDGSYLMLNSEIATSVMLGLKLTIVLLDNGGFGCIDRLQRATGGEPFNNLLQIAPAPRPPSISPRMPPASVRSRNRCRGSPNWRRHCSAPSPPTHLRHRASHRPAHRDGSGRPLVGCRRAGGVRPPVGAGARARTMKRNVPRKPWENDRMIRIGTNPIGWSNDDLRELGGDDAVGNLPVRSAPGRLSRASNSATNSPARAEALRAGARSARIGPGIRLVFRVVAHATVDAERAALRPHLDLLKAMGCTRAGVRRDLRRRAWRPRHAVISPSGHCRMPSGTHSPPG